MINQGFAYLVCIQSNNLPLSLYVVYSDDESFATISAIESYLAENNLPVEDDVAISHCTLLDTVLFHAYRPKDCGEKLHPFITVALVDNLDAQIHCIFARNEAHAERETLNRLNHIIPQLIEDDIVSVPYSLSINDVMRNAYCIPLMGDNEFDDNSDIWGNDIIEDIFNDDEDDDNDDEDE